MPPKKKEGPSKKTETKKKERIIEDKTFGMKNKKGAKAQKFIAQVEKQVKFGNQKGKDQLKLATDKNKKKDEKKKEIEELNLLFKPVAQVVAKGADPKSVLCAHFKNGTCLKGDRCKFSHDLQIGRRSEKKSIYVDLRRDDDEEAEPEYFADGSKKPGATSKVCKRFLEAVENNSYGWFWVCPDGGDKCIFRHALPQGYVLKKDQKKNDKKEEITIEELVERERAALGHDTTKVTLETFLQWKEKKKKEKIKVIEAEQSKKKSDYRQGKLLGISGRLMFEFNPNMIDDDDDEAEEEVSVLREEEDEAEDDGTIVDLNVDNIGAMAKEDDGTGTVMSDEMKNSRFKGIQERMKVLAAQEESEKLAEAGALPKGKGVAGDSSQTDAAIAAALSATVNGDSTEIAIDEDLFGGDDIDELDQDLDTLDLSD